MRERTKEKVLITRKIPKKGIGLLREHFEIKIFQHDRIITKDELIHLGQDCQYLLCLLTDPVDHEVLHHLHLKGIANYAVGYNNIDIKTATELGIPVCNTPGVLTEATADLTWALLLTLSRKILLADSFTRDGKFTGWGPLLFLGGDFYGKTLGIIGLGRIGTAVARRAKGFGMRVIYHNRSTNEEAEKELDVKKVPLEFLLKHSDYISIHCPYTNETHHLIDQNELSMMKKEAYLVNTARGKIINEQALIRSLEEEKIAGVALDVYYNEPTVSDELKSFSNTVLTPHIGSASIQTRTKMAIMAANNLIAIAEGERPPNLVNKEVFD